MDIRKYNRTAWDKQVKAGNKWTVPVSSEVIKQAMEGNWQIVLTPTIPVPKDWFPPLKGLAVLCLASGGGQQGPILSAAGARVTILDNSPMQLRQDRLVADRDSLSIRTVEGDMRDLSHFEDASFDLIFHPVSNVFVPDVRPVWREAFRVLRRGGVLLAGFMNPSIYIFDLKLVEDSGELHVKYKLPYADVIDMDESERQMKVAKGEPMEF
ncbi:MAG: class I SAM-dependent methyltransferase, partial [Candidatus Brocadiia bacterium]